jgi:hypothetical protein
MKNRYMPLILVLFLSCIIHAQVADAPDEVKNGIPVNYAESKVAGYTLPDPLKLADGTPVTTPKVWFEKGARKS